MVRVWKNLCIMPLGRFAGGSSEVARRVAFALISISHASVHLYRDLVRTLYSSRYVTVKSLHLLPAKAEFFTVINLSHE